MLMARTCASDVCMLWPYIIRVHAIRSIDRSHTAGGALQVHVREQYSLVSNRAPCTYSQA